VDWQTLTKEGYFVNDKNVNNLFAIPEKYKDSKVDIFQ
jgi:hypothetical protein